jgi:hypothetical protein
MKQYLSNPNVRLAGRAVVAGVAAALASYHQSGGVILWHGLLVAFVLAFAEVFTPLNAIVGAFTQPTPTPVTAAPPAAPPAPPAP